MKFYNSLTRRQEDFKPLDPGRVGLYTCGPTVYNFAHIGNLRTFLFQDLLKRTLRTAGYEVRHCMNLTDVDDKIIRDSQKDLPEDASGEAKHRYVCKVCGYVYEGDELPADYKCPLCGAGAEYFRQEA